jgi:hypothetical protein
MQRGEGSRPCDPRIATVASALTVKLVTRQILLSRSISARRLAAALAPADRIGDLLLAGAVSAWHADDERSLLLGR